MEIKKALKLRRKLKKKKPSFKRQEHYVKKLKDAWRRPRGKRSKLRMKEKARGKNPSPGYSSPKTVRGLSPSGFREVRVFNIKDIQKINKEKEIAVIGSGVGNKKRIEIYEFARQKEVKVK